MCGMKIETMLCVLSMAAALNAAPRWEDPAVNRVNALPTRALSIPCATREEAVRIARLEAERTESPYVMSLNGAWRFDWKHRPDVDWEKTGLDIAVPSCWQVYFMGEEWVDPPIYTNHTYPHVNNAPHIMEDPPEDYTSFYFRNPVGRYTRTFAVPEAWKGRRVVLRFNGVASAMEVRVNGREVGYAEDARLPAEFDVTDCLMQGEAASRRLEEQGEAASRRLNELEVTVYRWCDGSYVEDQDFWRLSGIYRDVWLMAESKTAPQDIVVEADAATGVVRCRDEKGALLHEEAISGFELWTPDAPNLYTVAFKAGGDWYAKNVGFRTIKIEDGMVKVNGERLVVKGVNRHEMTPTGGYSITHEEMERDIRLIKEWGFNAVRTCHYEDDSHWYDLCDKYGILLMAEANVESHGSIYGRSPVGELVNHLDWRQTFVERGTGMVKCYRNHVSIHFWSLGNECGDGWNLQHEYDRMKEIDSSRPIVYCTGPGSRHSDFYTPMYQTAEYGAKHAKGRPNEPYIQCEYSHAMGNASGNFADYWQNVREIPNYQGGFIWDFCDQALLGRDGFLKYGGDFGDKPNDSNFCCNGLFDAFRNPHPGAFEVRKVMADATSARLPSGETPLLPAIEFKPNFYRAPVDSDRGGKFVRDYRIWREATSGETPLPPGCESDLKTTPIEGGVKVEWTFKAARGLPDIPRVGLSFRLPKTLTNIAWYGRGPHENYADRNVSAAMGIYSATVAELNDSHYIRPGECGYRTDVKALRLTDASGRGVIIEGENFGFNVWPWTQEELERALHVEELRESPFLTVNIDAVQMGIGGDDAWGAKPLERYRPKSGKTYTLAFTVREI